MADKPIMTDIDINGQTEKFADPQHFTGENNEGRVKTGEKNPFPTANYVQNDSGLWLPVSKDNPVYTKLTGSLMEQERHKTEVILEREVRQGGYHNATLTQPKGANAVILSLIVRGITGNFSDKEGINIQAFITGSNSGHYYGYAGFEPTTRSNSLQVIEWAPGASDDKEVRLGGNYKSISGHFISNISDHRVRTFIDGTFSAGEGIDCEIKATWLVV